MYLYKVFTSEDYIERSSNPTFLYKIYKIFRNLRKLGKPSHILWSKAKLGKRQQNRSTVYFGFDKLNINWAIFEKRQKFDSQLFGKHRVYNQFIGSLQFPSSYIKHQTAYCSYIASAIYETIVKEKFWFLQNELSDPSKVILEGRSWSVTFDHFQSFLKGFTFTGESLKGFYKKIYGKDAGGISPENRIVNKKQTLETLLWFDKLYKFQNLNLDIKKKDLNYKLINPTAKAGFEENIISHGLKGFQDVNNKTFWSKMNLKLAGSLFERMNNSGRRMHMFIQEICTVGGREKQIKILDENQCNWRFTRLIQIPSGVCLILMGPLVTAMNNILRNTYITHGILFFEQENMSFGDVIANELRKGVCILEGDVKNHDRTVKFNEILAAWSIVWSILGNKKMVMKLIIFSISTMLNYYVQTPAREFFRLCGYQQTGNQATGLINSLVCKLRIISLFLHDKKLNNLINGDLTKVFSFNGGDDLLVSLPFIITDEIADHIIIKYWEFFGAELTDIKVIIVADWLKNKGPKPTFLGKAIKADGTIETPVGRFWKSFIGNSKSYLEGKGSIFNNLQAMMSTGKMPVSYVRFCSLLHVVVDEVVNKRIVNSGVTPSVEWGLHAGHYDRRSAWEASRDTIIGYIKDIDFGKIDGKLYRAENAILTRHYKFGSKNSTEWNTKLVSMVPLSHLDRELTDRELVLYKIYEAMVLKRVYLIKMKSAYTGQFNF